MVDADVEFVNNTIDVEFVNFVEANVEFINNIVDVEFAINIVDADDESAINIVVMSMLM